MFPVLILSIIIVILMFTRGNRQLLGGTKGATGQEDPWDLATSDLTPCDPTNSLIGNSTAWLESGDDLKPLASPATDDNWTVSGSDLISKAT